MYVVDDCGVSVVPVNTVYPQITIVRRLNAASQVPVMLLNMTKRYHNNMQ